MNYINPSQLQTMVDPARLVRPVRAPSVQETELEGMRGPCKRSLGLHESVGQLAPVPRPGRWPIRRRVPRCDHAFLMWARSLTFFSRFARRCLPWRLEYMYTWDFAPQSRIVRSPPYVSRYLEVGRVLYPRPHVRYVLPPRREGMPTHRHGVEWRTPGFQAAFSGLASAPAIRSRFAIIRPFRTNRFRNRETLATDFGRHCNVSFLPMIRIRSDPLPTARGFLTGPLSPNTPPPGKSFLGAVAVRGVGRLAPNLPARKCTASASALTRPCFLGEGRR